MGRREGKKGREEPARLGWLTHWPNFITLTRPERGSHSITEPPRSSSVEMVMSVTDDAAAGGDS